MNFRNQKLSSAQLYGIAAMFCPFLALFASAFDSYRNTAFWSGLHSTDEVRMMGTAEGMFVFLALWVGCFIGLGLSFFSLMKQANKFGMVALAINALLFLLFFC